MSRIQTSCLTEMKLSLHPLKISLPLSSGLKKTFQPFVDGLSLFTLLHSADMMSAKEVLIGNGEHKSFVSMVCLKLLNLLKTAYFLKLEFVFSAMHNI